MALLSYAPLRRWAVEQGMDPRAYDEVGPIFVHPQPCEDPPSAAGFPDELRGSRRMLRAYSADGHILGVTLVEPQGDFEGVLEALLADPQIALVHRRAVEFGCFTFEVRRNSACG